MSADIRQSRVRPPIYDLSEKDAATSSSRIRPQRRAAGQVDGEVGRGHVRRPAGHRAAGRAHAGRHARAERRQLRLGPVRQEGSVEAARVTGRMIQVQRVRGTRTNTVQQKNVQNAALLLEMNTYSM